MDRQITIVWLKTTNGWTYLPDILPSFLPEHSSFAVSKPATIANLKTHIVGNGLVQQPCTLARLLNIPLTIWVKPKHGKVNGLASALAGTRVDGLALLVRSNSEDGIPSGDTFSDEKTLETLMMFINDITLQHTNLNLNDERTIFMLKKFWPAYEIDDTIIGPVPALSKGFMYPFNISTVEGVEEYLDDPEKWKAAHRLADTVYS